MGDGVTGQPREKTSVWPQAPVSGESVTRSRPACSQSVHEKAELGLLWTDKALHVQQVGTRACITFFYFCISNPSELKIKLVYLKTLCATTNNRTCLS